MKIDHLTIDGIMAVPYMDIDTAEPLQLFVGQNQSGKTTVRDCVSLAITGNPIRVSQKSEFPAMICNGRKSAKVALLANGEGYQYSIPANEHTQKSLLLVQEHALPYVLEPSAFARLSEKCKRAFLLDLLPQADNDQLIVDELRKADVSQDQINYLLPLLQTGFHAAEQHCKAKASEAKGAWKQIAKETYGHAKAESWEPQGPSASETEHAREQLKAIDPKLTQQREIIRLLTEEIGALNVQMQRKAELDQLRTRVEKIPEIEESLGAYKKGLESNKQSLAGYQKIRQSLNVMLCPHCAKPVSVDSESGTLTPVKGTSATYGENKRNIEIEAIDYKIDDAERQARELAGVIDQLTRELHAAELAKEMLSKESEAEPGVDLDAKLAEVKRDQQAASEIAEMLCREHNKFSDIVDDFETASLQKKMADQQFNRERSFSKVAALLSPSGIPAHIVATQLSLINNRLNASCEATGWAPMKIGSDMSLTVGGLPYGLVSESAQWRADALIAECISHISGLKFFCLDRMDILDGVSRGQCIKWLLGLAKQRQVDSVFAMATLWKKPPQLPAELASVHDMDVPF